MLNLPLTHDFTGKVVVVTGEIMSQGKIQHNKYTSKYFCI